MRAGQLRHRLALQSVSRNQDSYGEAIETFATYATVWGSVEPTAGKELELGDQISGEVTHKVIIRHNTSVDVKDRISFDSRVYEINAILNWQERDIYNTLLCKEVV